MSWATVVVMAAVAYGVKLAGFGARSRPGRAVTAESGSTYGSRLVGLLPAAMFSGLVVTQTLADGSAREVVTRVAGVAVGAAVAVRTRSLTATLVTAAVVAAALRALW